MFKNSRPFGPLALFSICLVLLPIAYAENLNSAVPEVSASGADANANPENGDPGQSQTPAPSSTPPQTAAAPAAAPAAPAAPTALSSPSITGPLANLPPAIFDCGPLGKLSFNGFLSGLGITQSNHIPGDITNHAAVSNGFIILQKADGWFQFYVQAGAYNIPALGTPYLSTEKAITDLYSPVPVAYAKFQVAKNTSIQIGSLPTLIGAEYTFTFENMNIERGLLWNQENAVTKGIQINQTMGKFAASLAWTDGFYSNRYTWLSGSLAYTSGPHAISFVAGGNYSQTKFQTLATPVQNNGSIYNVIYTYTKGSWIIQPYFQYTDVPTDAKIGIVKGASTTGGAVLVSYAFKHGFSLPFRWEYIGSSGNVSNNAVNLLYGPGSSGSSITLTPTYQTGGFFARGDFSWTYAGDSLPGYAFGSNGTKTSQVRGALEIGFIFGNNIVEKK